MPRLSLIAAMARNRVIGRDNKLPWRLPADLKRFRTLTTGHPIIMGRKTFDSLGRALPNRHNIVMTRDVNFRADDVTVVNGISAAIAAAGDVSEMFVIGGAHVYEQLLPLADRLYLTLIDADVPGDAWFPDYGAEHWLETSRERFPADDTNSSAMEFVTLDRIQK
jgi:dihydrofolate reductase